MPYDRTIITDRLYLTPFAPEHTDTLFSMNSDLEIMRFLGGLKTREETEEIIVRIQARWDTLGYAWWVIFLKNTDSIIGFACLQNLANKESAPLEIGWRLIPSYQGNGCATEAGQAAMNFGFERVGVKYICLVADSENAASQKVMQRLEVSYVGIQTHYDVPCVYYEKHRMG